MRPDCFQCKHAVVFVEPLCIADDACDGQKFLGFSRLRWWPAQYEWGGRGIDMMSVDVVDLVIEKLLKKKEARLVGIAAIQYLADNKSDLNACPPESGCL